MCLNACGCRQKLRIPSKKPYIYFKCQSRKTIITWYETAEMAGGTGLSASTAVESIGFIASDCTFAVSGKRGYRFELMSGWRI